MKHLKNSNGAALVLTLMIITLLLLFILTLFLQVTNTNKQVNRMEQQHDARLIAEMGVTYLRTALENFDQEEEISNYLEEKVKEANNIGDLGGGRHFTLEVEIPEINEAASPIEITYTSIGVSGERTEEVEDTIKITYE
ncbi:hypothetical protein GLV94_03990 [Virgibacillus halodenitrificans]|uniref:Type 4 fimbrial biogenesis protein PilX N-terminal domain-containing protein n=1 Tax=Virgibacillus halodenitrificans TaxID=1482 RepID=A0ABR7VRL0_VIRHA|nr:hypothetical protein [Virgibacillus halodenitrificans]MBD1223925.1 hypothetical protein [Virgibacillus halodenitrificans]MCJ0931752.1 hypothetical protein [Virgibacillus halodenitrificans]MYL44794.1 hypothetical protein [Virgibacillus halodenitrificans]CDQ36997.1 Type II secretory pathway, component PulK [Virgibacillus halodenitrificans]